MKLGSIYPWMVSSPEEIESYGASLPLTVVEIVDPTIPSTFDNTGQELHPHMECDHTTPPIGVFDSLSSHVVLDPKLPP
jgi:hypothetical protein